MLYYYTLHNKGNDEKTYVISSDEKVIKQRKDEDIEEIQKRNLGDFLSVGEIDRWTKPVMRISVKLPSITK